MSQELNRSMPNRLLRGTVVGAVALLAAGSTSYVEASTPPQPAAEAPAAPELLGSDEQQIHSQYDQVVKRMFFAVDCARRHMGSEAASYPYSDNQELIGPPSNVLLTDRLTIGTGSVRRDIVISDGAQQKNVSASLILPSDSLDDRYAGITTASVGASTAASGVLSLIVNSKEGYAKLAPDSLAPEVIDGNTYPDDLATLPIQDNNNQSVGPAEVQAAAANVQWITQEALVASGQSQQCTY